MGSGSLTTLQEKAAVPTLQHAMFGRSVGNFKVAVVGRERLVDLVETVKAERVPDKITHIFTPRTAFTNRIAYGHKDSKPWTPWFSWSRDKADGYHIIGTNIAVATFNADCPVICLQQDRQLAVLHGGYRCLMRSDPTEPGIVESAVHYFDAHRVRAFIFGGIGPCCWAPGDTKPELAQPELCRHPDILQASLSTTTTASPFGEGQVSIDLYHLASELLSKVGVPAENITADTRCTCCATENGRPSSAKATAGRPIFWSHTHWRAGQQAESGHNMSIAWLET